MIENIKKEYLVKIKKMLGNEKYQLYLEALDKYETHGMVVSLKKIAKSNIDLYYLIDRFCAELIYKNENLAYLIYNKNYLLNKKIFPGKDPLYHAGLYYIQEPSAFFVIKNVCINESDVVLDLCASPGGKSIGVLYSLNKNKGGFLVSNEIDYKRVKILSSNIERMGFENVAITCNKSNELGNTFHEYFDKVVVDAPCSGEGMFRKSEVARKQWSENLVNSCAKIQRQLLEDAYNMLKYGGEIIYSTCTFSVEENEEIVNYFINKHTDLKVLKMDKQWPFNSLGEGQFYAIIKKGNEKTTISSNVPQIEDFNKVNLIKYGIEKYEKCKKENIPSHAYSHLVDAKFENIVELNHIDIEKYLKGEAIKMELPFKGYCKITYKNLGIGIAKYSNGMLKNHYPKGLRNF